MSTFLAWFGWCSSPLFLAHNRFSFGYKDETLCAPKHSPQHLFCSSPHNQPTSLILWKGHREGLFLIHSFGVLWVLAVFSTFWGESWWILLLLGDGYRESRNLAYQWVLQDSQWGWEKCGGQSGRWLHLVWGADRWWSQMVIYFGEVCPTYLNCLCHFVSRKPRNIYTWMKIEGD